MNLNDNSGPAFPCNAIWWTNKDGSESVHIGSNGMTLRDYFAAHAITICAKHSPKIAAKDAYRYADAMLAERVKGGAA